MLFNIYKTALKSLHCFTRESILAVCVGIISKCLIVSEITKTSKLV